MNVTLSKIFTFIMLVGLVFLLASYAQCSFRDCESEKVKVIEVRQEPVVATTTEEEVIPEQVEEKDNSISYELNFSFLNSLKQNYIASGTRFVDIDLNEMELKVYDEGEVVQIFSVLTKGREGSWWETPIGAYTIELKKPDHVSSFAHVHQPWSMVVHGNFFIHGWPHYDNGTPVSSSFSGGCIRLDTTDSKSLYDSVLVGDPVVIRDTKLKSKVSTSTKKVFIEEKILEARSYLVANLDTGEVIASHNIDEEYPIASISKLMTAVVALEQTNLDRVITVPSRAIVYTSKTRLYEGQRINAYDLVYPLLTESSNEAAITIAYDFGYDWFVTLMNKKATSLGMKKTTFTDPAGRDEGNVATVKDIAILAKYILEYRQHVFDISASRFGGNSFYGQPSMANLGNYNFFSDDTSFVGGKTGQTNAAMETMVAVFDEDIVGE